jgi:UDP-glucuronate 4-epimerase
MTRYLLTGAAGFIGSHVAENLLSNGHQVVGLDNLNDAYDTRLKKWRLARLEAHKDFVFHEIDIVERESLHEMCGDGDYSAVINLAARAGVRQSVRNPGIYYQTNVLGTLNLLDLCKQSGIQKFVQASTSSLYGAHNPRPFEESADVSRPLSPYAASKGAAELLCYSYHHLYGLDITVLRYFTVYGPAGRPDMSVFRFIQWIAENRPLILYGDGYQERDFTYVVDIAHGTLSALRPLGFEIINLGGDYPVSIIEVIRRIENLLGKQAAIDQHGEAPADVRATWANINKARALLEWEPQVALQEGLEITANWYLAEREWASQIDTTD